VRKLLALVCVVALVGCGINFNRNDNDVDVIVGPSEPKPSPSPSPSPKASPSAGNPSNVASVRVGPFGSTGNTPNGTRPYPLSGSVVVYVTATPKKADGSDASEADHGQNIRFETSGPVLCTPSSSNPLFNRDCKGNGSGPATLTAILTLSDGRVVSGVLDFTVTP
jgi:hypothetical protein